MNQIIDRLAARQHGVVTRGQLLEAGVSPDVVDRRRDAWLRPMHRGVYRVGPVQMPRAREMAAALACGPSAVVSHQSAAGLWLLLPDVRPSPSVHILIPAGNRRRPGIRVHRIGTLRRGEVTRMDGIPLTTVARTLYDLAPSLGSRELERALAEALARRLTERTHIEAILTRHAARRGSKMLHAVLEGEEPAFTRSEAEERFLDLVRKARLDPPKVNARTAGYEVNFLWTAQRLVVEIDGFAFHSSPGAFEHDRRRDSELTAAGLRVIRVTWRQLVDEPEAVLVRLAKALATQLGRGSNHGFA